MDALNEKERTIALVKFLGMFLVTVILVLVAAFYGTKAPQQQLNLLTSENAQLKVGLKNTRSIITSMDSIAAKMGRYNTELNKEILAREIADELQALSRYSYKDTTDFGNILSRVGLEYKFHLADKKALSTSGDCSATLIKMQMENEKLVRDLKDCNQDLTNLNLKIQAGSQ